MLVAYRCAKGVLPDRSSRFSRQDFTLPQLFACLVVREHQRKSYRGTEALLRDSEHWCRQIGMKKVPDHNTLCRAFHAILAARNVTRLLDLLSRWMAIARQLGQTLALDSSLYDTHHRSRHYEQRCRHHSTSERKAANSRRSASARRTPKLALGIDTRSHLVLSARPRTGMGSDCRDFAPLVDQAQKRRGGHIKVALADAGYDSEANHRHARHRQGIVAWIKTGAGRPTLKPPAARYRRQMHRRLSGSQAGKPYGQRAQVETVHSMIKRNLGDGLRARTPRARRREHLLKVLTHNIMIVRSCLQRVETEPMRPRCVFRGAGIRRR